MATHGLSLFLVAVALVFTHGEEVPCHSRLTSCANALHQVAKPAFYTMPQGMHRPNGNRSYEDSTYSPNYRPQYVRPWSGGDGLNWLSSGKGQLTDDVCGDKEFRQPEDQYPWVGWNSHNIRNGSSRDLIPLYFSFDPPISLTSLKTQTLNPQASGIALFQYAVISVAERLEDSAWVVVANRSARPQDYTNTSKALIITFDFPAPVAMARFVRLQIAASDRVVGSVSHPWVMISEVAFCAKDYSQQVATVASQSPVTFVEGEQGAVPCTGENVDYLELIRGRDGVRVTNVSGSMPGTLAVSFAVMTPRIPLDDDVYLCRGNNSMTGSSNAIAVRVIVVPALDIFRGTNATVVHGGSVLLKCCFKDNRRNTITNPLNWEWRVKSDVHPLIRDSRLPYLIIDNITTDELLPVVRVYECRVQLGSQNYRDYRHSVSVRITDGSATQRPSAGSMYSNPLANDLCDASAQPPAPATATVSTPVATVPTSSGPTGTADSADGDDDDDGGGFGATSAVLLVCLVVCAAALVLVLVLFRQRQRKHGFKHRHMDSNHSRRVSTTSPINRLTPTINPDLGETYAEPDLNHTLRKNINPDLGETYAEPDLNHSLRKNRSNTYGDNTLVPYDTAAATISRGSANGQESLSPAVYASIQSPDKLQIYTEPDQSVQRLLPQLSDNRIYEEASDFEKIMLTSQSLSPDMSKKEKRMTRLVPLYEEPPPLPKQAVPLVDPAKLSYSESDKLGEGQFGDVYRATLMEVKPKVVAIKTLKSGTDSNLRQSFEKEVKFMWRQQHAHVVRLLGICDSKRLTAMVMENMANGDLHSYLNKYNLETAVAGESPATAAAAAAAATRQQQDTISLATLVGMMQQIASGMEYLSANAYVHRDLAARNCLVAANKTIKLGDFGLTCHLYDRQYYRVVGKAVLPLQWMAPESFFGQFSKESDVFSFGITCWEILTMCRMGPFADLEPDELITVTLSCRKNGMERPSPDLPSYCPPPIRELLKLCWKMEKSERPTFQHLNAELKKISEHQKRV